jgi:hypothetical protein
MSSKPKRSKTRTITFAATVGSVHSRILTRLRFDIGENWVALVATNF